MAEKTTREAYTLDWSQSKVFLVVTYFRSHRQARARRARVACTARPASLAGCCLLVVLG